jgi:hypothetical protein
MRLEAPVFLLYGALLCAGVWAVTRASSSVTVKKHLRALAFALGLGVAVIAGHGEGVVVPLLAILFKTRANRVLDGLGLFFFVLWYALALAALSRASPRKQ